MINLSQKFIICDTRRRVGQDSATVIARADEESFKGDVVEPRQH